MCWFINFPAVPRLIGRQLMNLKNAEMRCQNAKSFHSAKSSFCNSSDFRIDCDCSWIIDETFGSSWRATCDSNLSVARFNRHWDQMSKTPDWSAHKCLKTMIIGPPGGMGANRLITARAGNKFSIQIFVRDKLGNFFCVRYRSPDFLNFN